MARQLRVEYPGAIYHVINRGDRREAIFHDDADRQRFLETLGETCAKTGWQVHAFCLMSNHFHLVLETPQGNLVAGMKWFLGTSTSQFNRVVDDIRAALILAAFFLFLLYGIGVGRFVRRRHRCF